MENIISSKMKVGNAAKVTGASIVLMAIVAMITVGMFHEALFPQSINDGVVLKHMEGGSLLAAVIGWSVICVLDFIVSWGVYVILKDEHKTLAVLSSALRFIYTGFLCIATSKIVQLFLEVRRGDLSVMDLSQRIEQTGIAFDNIWQLGLIIFGVHLLMTGATLILTIPKMKPLFVILMIGGVGYCITSSLILLGMENTSTFGLINGVMLLPMILGELGLGIWLLVKGKASFDAA